MRTEEGNWKKPEERTLSKKKPFHPRPLLHAMYSPGVKGSFGIELDQVKVGSSEARRSLLQIKISPLSLAPQVRKAEAFIKNTLADMEKRGLHCGGGSAGIKGGPLRPEIHCCRWDPQPPSSSSSWHSQHHTTLPAHATHSCHSRHHPHSRTSRQHRVVRHSGARPACLLILGGYPPRGPARRWEALQVRGGGPRRVTRNDLLRA